MGIIISQFFNSYLGMYIAQAFCHSLTAALIVDRAVQVFKITTPLMRQRFSFMVIVLPLFSFPLYQAINPGRSSVSFRMEALFDINRWLSLDLWGTIPAVLLFVGLLTITSLVFLFQEMIPVIKHMMESRGSSIHDSSHRYDPLVDAALEQLPGKKPLISVIDDDDLILLSKTGKQPTLILSTGLIESLDQEQLQAAMAHEIAHIERNRRLLLETIFVMRMLLFFNPVVLVEFRRIVHEEEKICDDIAVTMTRKPHALSASLKKFNDEKEEPADTQGKGIAALADSLQDYSHSIHLESRIARLEQGTVQKTGGEWFTFVITLMSIIIINYFIV